MFAWIPGQISSSATFHFIGFNLGLQGLIPLPNKPGDMPKSTSVFFQEFPHLNRSAAGEPH